MGFVGIIFKSVSARLVFSAIVTSTAWMEVMFSPTPGLITLAVRMATVIARAVVTKYSPKVFTPILPSFLVSPIAMLPQTRELNTNGTTSICISLRNPFPTT